MFRLRKMTLVLLAGATITACRSNSTDSPLDIMAAAGCDNPQPIDEPLTEEFYDRKWNCTVDGHQVTFTTFESADKLDRLLEALGPEVLDLVAYVEGPERLWTASATTDTALTGFRTR